MAINTSLLVAAPMLQDYLVDKDTGGALANGTITLYRDSSRTTLKSWYRQSGTAGAYTYVALPNPLTLSSSGTITDANGNDVIPFYYPYTEDSEQDPDPYYIVVQNSNGEQQFTRQNFPFVAPTETQSGVPTLKNILINNVFWRNITSITATNLTNTVIAPGAHDGFSYPDIRFIKDVTGAVDTITFSEFPLGNTSNNFLDGGITPQYYLNLNCTGIGTETVKYIQMPISLHLRTLEQVSATFTIWAKNESGNINNRLTISIYQFTGTGTVSPDPNLITTLTLTNEWTLYTASFVFNSAANVTLGDGGDDAFYIQFGYPVATTTNISFTKPSIYLSERVPTNDFDTYDQIDAVINSPRTGDVRTSLNSFYPYGWVLMDDGTVGSSTSNATNRANIDTYRLYDLIWNSFQSNQSLAPMYNSSGASVSYGANSIADFSANNQIALTRTLGRVLAGTLPAPISQTCTRSSSLLVVSSSANFYTGVPVTLTTTGTLPSPLVVGTVYYAIQASSTQIGLATSPENAIAGTNITLLSNGTGVHTITVPAHQLGKFLGEETHQLTVSELAAHTHSIQLYNNNCGAGATRTLDQSTGASAVISTNSAGNDQPHNNMQPTSFLNIYMKL